MNLLELLYLMIPAYVANMMPLIVKRVPINAPMDFGLSMGRKRILGDNKTWKGFIAGILGGVLVGVLLSRVYWPANFSPFAWSALVASGALLGDAVKSFVKRRMNFKSGESWFPFDQIDFSMGAIALASVIYFPGWLNALAIVAISFVGHIVVNHVSFYLGIRNEKW